MHQSHPDMLKKIMNIYQNIGIICSLVLISSRDLPGLKVFFKIAGISVIVLGLQFSLITG